MDIHPNGTDLFISLISRHTPALEPHLFLATAFLPFVCAV